MTVELAFPATAELGEGPVWDDRTLVLHWVDLLGNRVHTSNPRTGATATLPTDVCVSAVAPTERSLVLAATPDGVAVLDLDSGERELRATIEQNTPTTRTNDGKTDPQGRYWIGTMNVTGTGRGGTLYRIGHDFTVTPVVTSVGVSNGLGWNPQCDRMYFVDTTDNTIDVFDFEPSTGAITNRRPFVRFEADPAAVPDGLTVDSEGGVWIAMCFAGQVRRYDTLGQLDAVIHVPATLTTSVTFGGATYSDLFITTGRVGLSDEQLTHQPDAGSVFVTQPGINGLRTTRFASSARAQPPTSKDPS